MATDPEILEANRIRAELWDLRRRLKAEPCANPLIWVIPDRLACAQRPLRDHPKFQDQQGRPLRPLPPEAGPEVTAWVQRI